MFLSLKLGDGEEERVKEKKKEERKKRRLGGDDKGRGGEDKKDSDVLFETHTKKIIHYLKFRFN